MAAAPDSIAVLEQLAAVIESRKPSRGGEPDTSYVARLLHRGPDAFLKKIGEEATEVVMAAKDVDNALLAGSGVDTRRGQLVGEVADLWFHCLIALAHYDLSPADVLSELQRRAGTSGIEEKALRKVAAREQGERNAAAEGNQHG
jgi:phosphoribosyl-ATP pyrophosphohydrolase